MRRTKSNATKLLAFTLLIAMVCSPLILMALAAPDDNRAQISSEESASVIGDGQTLYAFEDNASTTSDGNPLLIQERDSNTTKTNDGASTSPTEDTQGGDEPNLIANQTIPENTAVFAGAGALAAAIAVGAGVVVVRLRKK